LPAPLWEDPLRWAGRDEYAIGRFYDTSLNYPCQTYELIGILALLFKLKLTYFVIIDDPKDLEGLPHPLIEILIFIMNQVLLHLPLETPTRVLDLIHSTQLIVLFTLILVQFLAHYKYPFPFLCLVTRPTFAVEGQIEILGRRW
jgi:hypothetical protein